MRWVTPQKFNKETSELNNTIDQKDLTYIYQVFLSAVSQYTFFSAVHETFHKILVHKGSLCKYKKIEITPCILSHHNGIQLEPETKINYRKYSHT
jgi:hypothetical protein